MPRGGGGRLDPGAPAGAPQSEAGAARSPAREEAAGPPLARSPRRGRVGAAAASPRPQQAGRPAASCVKPAGSSGKFRARSKRGGLPGGGGGTLHAAPKLRSPAAPLRSRRHFPKAAGTRARGDPARLRGLRGLRGLGAGSLGAGARARRYFGRRGRGRGSGSTNGALVGAAGREDQSDPPGPTAPRARRCRGGAEGGHALAGVRRAGAGAGSALSR